MPETAVAGGGASTEDNVLFSRHGDVGRITLNRPRALNALTLPMIEELHACLDRWVGDPGAVLVLDSASPKAFCAGGDIRAIRQNTLEDRHDDSMAFFAAEYELNARLAEFKTPIVALIDGICMGGGLGLSVHGPFRVLTERALMAMPETAIGFFPDVGASYFLSRLPGALGVYLGVSGYRVDAADALYVGLGTHLVADTAAVVPALQRRRDKSIDEVLRGLAQPTIGAHNKPSGVAVHRDEIAHCFGMPTIGEIWSRLKKSDTPWARHTMDTLAAMSPLSLDVTVAVLTAGKQMSLRQCLDMELQVSNHLVRTPDFVEGVRAMLVDKDRAPQWTGAGAQAFDIAAVGFSLR